MMELPPLEYTFDHIVLGWREEAVSFAREHGYHLIVNSDQRPFHHFVGCQDIKSKWYEGIFDLGMRSLLPIPFDVQTVGLNEEGRLKIVTEGNTKVLINFKQLHLFDLDNCGSLGVEEVITDYLVHDMFDITAGSCVGRDIVLKPRGAFVNLIEFVTSNRIDRNTSGDFKDILTTSVISHEEIKQPDGRSLKITHSFRHTIKNTFQLKPFDDLDDRIVLHE